MKNKVNIQELEEYILREQIEIESIKVNRSDKIDMKVEMELIFSPKYDKTEFLNRLVDYPGVISVRG